MPRASQVAIVSFRLGGSDGVSIEAAKWACALERLGYEPLTVAGEGPVDRLLPGLAIAATQPPSLEELTAALCHADLVVVENLCSLPLNPAAADVVAACLRGRPAVLHDHDLAWQRPHLAHLGPPPDDPAWRHVTINDLSRLELAERSIRATTIYNTFDPDPPPGGRDKTRDLLGLQAGDRLVLQPTRALARKGVAAGVALAEASGATFWLLGPAEDGYGPELDAILLGARCPIRRGMPPGCGIEDAYAVCDLVALPSSWEGFGNPTVESATHLRPLAIGSYPVARELMAFGFEWLDADDPGAAAQWFDHPNSDVLAHNAAVARRHFSLYDLPERLGRVLEELGGAR